jgi:uncharacterized protein with ATP-grasp and redox domains
MKVGSRCGYCLIHRGYKIINLSTSNEKTRLKAVSELLKLLGEKFSENTVPSIIGTDRNRLIARITKCNDPYSELKKKENIRAMKFLPRLKENIIAAPKNKRLGMAALISCLGNVIDYDVPGNNSDIDDAFDYIDEGFYIDDIDKLRVLLEEGKEVLFLTDNAGEIAFDTLFVQELKDLGCHVTVAVKGGASINDALLEDALMVGMDKISDEIMTTGIDAIGIRLDESPDSFIQRFNSADIIIAKGMANWETLTETPAPCPILYVYRTKCEPVAKSIGAPLHKSIAFLIEKGWKL